MRVYAPGGQGRPPLRLLPNASGGSLSFCGERKGGKNAAKTNGFGFLSADRIQLDLILSGHANAALWNSCFTFVWPLRLIPRRAPRLCWPGGTGLPSASTVWGVGEIGEAPPVADAARRFRGSAPIGWHDSAGESAGTTVLPRRLSRVFARNAMVMRCVRSSFCIFCRSRKGRGRCGRSSAPGGAAFSRCRRRRRSRRWPWPPAHA